MDHVMKAKLLAKLNYMRNKYPVYSLPTPKLTTQYEGEVPAEPMRKPVNDWDAIITLIEAILETINLQIWRTMGNVERLVQGEENFNHFQREYLLRELANSMLEINTPEFKEEYWPSLSSRVTVVSVQAVVSREKREKVYKAMREFSLPEMHNCVHSGLDEDEGNDL